MPNIYRDFGNIFRPILFDSSSLYFGITLFAWSFVARLSFVHPSLFLRSSFALPSLHGRRNLPKHATSPIRSIEFGVR